jgi:hypothetical protein
MTASSKDYVMLCGVLRKMSSDESYQPTGSEKKETKNIQPIVHDRIWWQM